MHCDYTHDGILYNMIFLETPILILPPCINSWRRIHTILKFPITNLSLTGQYVAAFIPLNANELLLSLK